MPPVPAPVAWAGPPVEAAGAAGLGGGVSSGPAFLGAEALGASWKGSAEELETVRCALASGEVYLGMEGSTLVQYMLEVQANENLLLQLLLRSQVSPGYPAAAGAAASSSMRVRPDRHTSPPSTPSFSVPSTAAVVAAAAAAAAATAAAVAGGARPEAAEQRCFAEAVAGPGTSNEVEFWEEVDDVEVAAAAAVAQAPPPQSVVLRVPASVLAGEYREEVGLQHHGRPVFAQRAPLPGVASRPPPTFLSAAAGSGGAAACSAGAGAGAGGPATYYCYYWDAPEGPADWRGWWIGSEVGGIRVAAFAPAPPSPSSPSAQPAQPGAPGRPGAEETSAASHTLQAAAGGLPPERGWQVFGCSPEGREASGEELRGSGSSSRPTGGGGGGGPAAGRAGQ